MCCDTDASGCVRARKILLVSCVRGRGRKASCVVEFAVGVEDSRGIVQSADIEAW